jgi:predicted solute-binding protein
MRLGRIAYVNMAPVFYRVEADYEEVAGVPTELNRRLLAGAIDTAPISSIEWARNADKLRLLPRLCVSSEGAVDSIQLVSRQKLDDVRVVAVTPESATSVVLTKVLLPRAAHVPLGEEADATLLIGDAALKSAFEDPTPHHDLGRLWLERTGLPMVFAVWACPEPLADGLAELEDALVAVRAPSPSGSPSRPRSAMATPPASWRATSRSCAIASARASARGCSRSSSSRATSANWPRCPRSASSRRRRRRPYDGGDPRAGARRRADQRRGRGRAAALA